MISLLLHRFWAFLQRDFYTEISYRLGFLGQILGIFMRAILFFFLAELIGDTASPYLQAYDGDYFAFVLIGIAFGSYFGVGLNGFAAALREAQTTGTLEAMILTPTPVSILILGSALWSYVFTTFRVLVYLVIGVLLGVSLSQANYLAAFVVLILAITSFASIGILAASIIMIIKRGNPVTAILGNAANLVGGVFYPIELLPDWLQWLAYLLPITHALEAMRLALLTDASWQQLLPYLFALLGFCVVLLPCSLWLFRYAVNRARADGSLAHY